MRALGGIIAGLLIGLVIALALTIVSIVIHPFPRDFNPRSANDLATYYETAPFLALFMIVLGRFLGALAGGWVANAISGTRWTAWVIGIALCAYIVIEMSGIPHPLWMQITGVLAPLVGAAIAHHFAGRSRIEEDEVVEEDEPHDEVSEL
ncbi:hypothetical protein [Allosphingosinicella vermicomposti]|uniref:hypothetical protein n=1 Tax=Allosphingosinicella vermicomposti TaxID=614671 RepID=UPI000D0EE86F|nr:hypothetical protein [Allosphingosinicella vermicomposti]